MAALRTPPGRAGRLRLRHSLDVAVRGAGLLDRKLSILRARHEELLRVEQETGEVWRQRIGQAETWLLRGLLLGGQEALSAAVPEAPAELRITWTSTMGVRHPASAVCVVPPLQDSSSVPGNTALIHARAAYATAVRAAAEHAVARAAAETVGAEVRATRQRVRALRRHWIPRLEAALARTELALEQGEHEDAVRRRWSAAAARTPGEGR
ncbi:V-type ATP synthase subunit D [Streptomyces sp. NPDC053560]|uniref:V-type ATP synthase subunit D n=1 Tax=Streptomyces sp. NPDC053560 TaxID=3365711 RepID=UPI0037D661AA